METSITADTGNPRDIGAAVVGSTQLKTDSNSNNLPQLPGLGGVVGGEQPPNPTGDTPVSPLSSSAGVPASVPLVVTSQSATIIPPTTSTTMNGQAGSGQTPTGAPGTQPQGTGTGGPTPTTGPTPTNTTRNTGAVKSCAGCGARIIDRFLLHAMDRYWHTNCLKCSCCQAQLGEIGTSCFAKAGMILCKNDYVRLFGSSGTCASCGQSIPASEFVMKAQGNVYHLNCFTCVACNNRLVPGDRYSIVNGSLICEHDYPKVIKGHTQIPLRASHKVRILSH